MKMLRASLIVTDTDGIYGHSAQIFEVENIVKQCL